MKKDRDKAVEREVDETSGGYFNFIYSPKYELLMTSVSFAAFAVLIWQSSSVSAGPTDPPNPVADLICSIIEAIFRAVIFADACIMFYAMGK